jgi:hypothetical protein
MRAPFAQRYRGVQLTVEVPEAGQPGQLVVRRTVSSGAPHYDGLEESFVLTRDQLGAFLDWLMPWLMADGTYRWLRLGRELDVQQRLKLNRRQKLEVQT